eukprot:CAMPEP_0171458290 /NCGR_PEP_ID=MMETSP0945-20130129/4031_1 /TAXON_ID=109269 /ORGANISM="Vaucheria litorea, Strain CCMP2940" /LENGTH=337 /DNA_ID=CAMNT_0011984075 /DNA_START=67 /DNA_END=1077 /DNA_ORIENTATION=-
MRVCTHWHSFLSSSVVVFQKSISNAGTIPNELRAAFYIHVIYDQPAWLGRSRRKNKSVVYHGPIPGVYQDFSSHAAEFAKTALLDQSSSNGKDRNAARMYHDEDLATSFKIIEADLERTRPALLFSRSSDNDIINESFIHGGDFDKDDMIVTAEEMKESLRRVLRAFAVRSNRVKYCQGMNFVALALLEAAKGNEEKAFWVLCGLSEKLSMVGVWSPGLHRLEFAIFALERMLWDHDSRLAQHFELCDVRIGMFASKWFITIFQCHDTFGKTAASRIMDIFICERWPALLRIALVVLLELSSQLQLLDLEGILAGRDTRYYEVPEESFIWNCIGQSN